MASNEKLVRERYSNAYKEDSRATVSRANSIEFMYTKMFAGHYINPTTSVIEIGCGTGYYGMHFADKCKEYVGIDLSPENINLFNSKIINSSLLNVKAMVGDAVNLNQISDFQFDVVLALGPMYHLPESERELVFKECKRICKNNGVIIIAYITKLGTYVKACLDFPDKYPNLTVNDIVFNQGTDDIRPGVLFFMTPEEIGERARAHGLSIIKNIGVDFVFKDQMVNEMNEKQFEAWLEISDLLCESQACTGLSNHALIICKKESF